MPLIPAQCDACAHYSLQAASALASGDASSGCACGGVNHALPGETYGPNDRGLFDAIVRSLATAGIAWTSATRLAIELDGCRAMPAAVQLMRLAQLAPALTIIELVAATESATDRKAVGMLTTLLEAISKQRN